MIGDYEPTEEILDLEDTASGWRKKYFYEHEEPLYFPNNIVTFDMPCE